MFANRQKPITIVIPTWNCVDDLRATLQSVQEQDYNHERLFYCFVDFGSTDGTQELLLELPRKHTALLNCTGKPLGRTVPAKTLQMISSQSSPGRPFVLWPGDLLYRNALRHMETLLRRAWKEHLSIDGVLAEVDVREEDGTLCHQKPLFTTPALFRGHSSDSLAYVDRGYKHQILLYGCFTKSTDKVGVHRSYIRHWNQVHYLGLFSNMLYTPEVLASVRRFHPQDELDDLLWRYEMLICSLLSGMNDNVTIIAPEFEATYRRNLAHYALWRAYLILSKGDDAKVAEDCFLLTRIICPEIEKSECWQRVQHLLESGGEENAAWLAVCFAREEEPSQPKLPVGGIVRRWQRQWKLFRSHDDQTAFSSL